MTSVAAGSRVAGGARLPRGARSRAVRAGGLVVALALLGGACLLSLGVGARGIPPSVVIEALLAYDGSDLHGVVIEGRLPRTVIGLLAGLALGGCGTLIQAYTRNPLADPGILGVNAGSVFAVTMGAGLLGLRAPIQYVWLAFAGALGVTLLVYLVGRATREGASPVRMTLTGVALGAVLTGITSAVVLKNLPVFAALRFWGVGSLGGRDPEAVATIVPFLLAGIVVAAIAARSLNAIALGDELGSSLGANVRVTRALAIVGVTVLAGSAVALAGPIAFVGLMVPHLARGIVGPDQRWILALSLVLAPSLLLVSDVLGRLALPNGELPVGIVTAVVGAPALIALARRRRMSGL